MSDPHHLGGIVVRPGFQRDLAQRTLTKLYNQRLAWHDDVVAVAALRGQREGGFGDAP